jgi:ubiquinone/menaquinone biosynthesis C-methylase UbiE
VNRAKIIANEIIKSIPIKEHYRALDFGCGTGLISFNLLDRFEHITLVDPSKGMIDQLNRKIQDSRAANMTSIQTDINNDPLLIDRFDVIYTSMALHHILDTKATLKKLYDLLSDEGHLCIVELNEDDGSFHKSEKDFKGHDGFNQNALKMMLEELGLKNVSANTFYNDHKIEDGSKINYSLFLMAGEKIITR